MVQLGNVQGKDDKHTSKDDGDTQTDTAPLLTSLDASQLEQNTSEKEKVKTRTDFDPKKFHRIAELAIDIGDGVSEKFKMAVLVFFALAFLSCIVFLVVYKVYRYDQACPEGFLIKHDRCIPAASLRNAGRGSLDARFYSLVSPSSSHSDLPRSISPWIASLLTHKKHHGGAG
uniref:Calcyon neuron-specific vesicular protein n=1 Tax=Eptatretus burgeri TaxID=7764 RepID=A0A8C4N9I4_EPTBU